MTKCVAIIGGNGKVGKYLVEQAIEKGYRVRILSRNPKQKHVNDESVTVIKGDARNYEAIAQLLRGSDVVINTIGQPKGERSIFAEVTSQILIAMKQENVNRYITVAGGSLTLEGDKKTLINRIGATLFKLLFAKMIKDKEKEVELLKESDIDWTVVRLPFIVDQQEVKVIKEDLFNMPGTKMTSRNVATFLLRQIDNKTYIRKHPFVSN
ncbi:NAD(P)H-binding protein [Alkalihalobacillus sp. LMS39]|uniref:NAD(P)-dependent oxidoreductase n=1 Tax=Alkalihalobacillus sp. LMS39 TaxID=2924032 RepID=UPI001FB1AABC|nr:NAD(P)H-binding protein [Alkalihalobacillus sp. LMS39]UOE94627.1 NAD(P)H-binding protein [Alkalihalobacillus sp. LMS39]